jgi:hypothetical protein
MTDSPQQNASGSDIAQAYGKPASPKVTITVFRPEEVTSVTLPATGAVQQTRIDKASRDMRF